MSDEQKIREALAEEIKTRGAQTKIAQAIGVTASTVQRWATGDVPIPPAMQKLLGLYLFGEIPFELARDPQDAMSLLEFTEAEWQIISILAARAGQTPKSWIRSQILAYLAYQPSILSTLPLVAEPGKPYSPTASSSGDAENVLDMTKPPKKSNGDAA